MNDRLPNVIKKISENLNINLIDTFNSLGGDHLFKLSDFLLTGQEIKWPHDGCHPNDFGYFDIANTISYILLNHAHNL